jgi:hypothetical protein
VVQLVVINLKNNSFRMFFLTNVDGYLHISQNLKVLYHASFLNFQYKIFIMPPKICLSED